MAVDTELLPPRYRVPRRLGRGAMGDIYLATDELLGREVAVKVLADRYAADEGIRERFKREALAAARLSGEAGAVTIFDVGEWDGRPTSCDATALSLQRARSRGSSRRPRHSTRRTGTESSIAT